MVRIYLTEGETQLAGLVKRLKKWEKLRGLTVFRGISGYGESGVIHDAKLIDLAMDLPLVLEFFDEPEKIEPVLAHLNDYIKPGHIVTWSAKTN
jgi:PII-like signaling protein